MIGSMISRTDSPILPHRYSNGLTLVVEPMPWLATVSLSVLLPFGSTTDPESEEGSAAVLSEWLQRGSGGLSSRAISDRLDGLGVRRGGGSGCEYSSFSASMLTESLDEALPLLISMVRAPSLADDEFAASRTLVSEELASLEDSPAQLLFEALARQFFASRHRRSSYGSVGGLARIDAATVRADGARRLSPRGAVVAIAGGVERQHAIDLVGAATGEWRGHAIELEAPALREPERDHIDAQSAQVQIGLAFEAVPPDHPDWYHQALSVAILSGGMGSRLHTEVREKRGLVYTVSAQVRSLRGFAYTIGYAGTTPERVAETLEVLRAEIGGLGGGAAPDELDRARVGVLSNLVMQGESSSARAGALASDTFLRGAARGLGEIQAAISAPTLGEVNDFLAARPDPDPTILTLGRDVQAPA